MRVKTFISFGEIDKNGSPSAYNKQDVLDFCKRYPSKRLEITYRVMGDIDTSQQMRYYRAVVVPNIQQGLSNEGIRMNRDQVHDLLRQRSAIRTKTISVLETIWTEADSTSDFDKEEFSDYIEECIQFAAEELSVAIPEPIYERFDFTK